MERVAPVGPVYQAGTLSGNPVAVSAGLTTLKALREPGFYRQLDQKSARLEEELASAADQAGVAVQCNRVGSMMTAFFTRDPVADYASARKSDTAVYARFFNEMLRRGIYLAPSQFEAAFVSSAHSEEDLDATAEAAREVMRLIRA